MSFEFGLEPKDEAAAELVAKVGSALRQALAERKQTTGLTQSEIARRLGIDKSRVNRCFSGAANLSLETLGELLWALDARMDLAISCKDADPTINRS